MLDTSFSSPTNNIHDVVNDVQRHYEACKNAEDSWWARALDDLRFFHDDVHNHWQWEENVWNARTGQYGGSSRPTIAQAKAQTDAYKSETDRMAAIGSIDPNAFRPFIAQLVSEALQQGAPSPSQQSTPNAVQSLLQPEQEDQNQGPSEPLHRLPSNNPPGGPIHDPNPITGALEP